MIIDPIIMGISIALIFVVLMIVLRGVKIVSQGTEAIVETFGKYTGTLTPGLHLINPFFSTLSNRVSIKECVLDIPHQQAVTKDNAMIDIDGVLMFKVTNAAQSVYHVNDLDRALENIALTNLRSVVGSLDLDEILSKRDEINTRLLSTIDAASDSWGVRVTRVELKEIAPPSDIVQSMARVMKAERDRRAAILEAEGVRKAEILKAEAEKESVILKAEGELRAAELDAKARERLAEAEAAAVKTVSSAIAEGDIQAVNYFVAKDYIDGLAKIASSHNTKTFMLPVESTGMIGSIGGIADIAKEVLQQREAKKGGW